MAIDNVSIIADETQTPSLGQKAIPVIASGNNIRINLVIINSQGNQGNVKVSSR